MPDTSVTEERFTLRQKAALDLASDVASWAVGSADVSPATRGQLTKALFNIFWNEIEGGALAKIVAAHEQRERDERMAELEDLDELQWANYAESRAEKMGGRI